MKKKKDTFAYMQKRVERDQTKPKRGPVAVLLDVVSSIVISGLSAILKFKISLNPLITNYFR